MEITKTTVNASDGHFEEHPESYRPRVFAAIMPPMQYRRGGEDGLTPTGREEKVYEILSNGQAIPWPCLPKELCGFDFWVLYVESLSDVTMMRHAPQIPRIPQAVWDALKESQDMAEKASQAACYPYHADIPTLRPIMGSSGKVQIGEVVEYNPVPQADGDGCTCLKGGPGCDTWEEYPGQPWGEFAKNSECPIHGEDR